MSTDPRISVKTVRHGGRTMIGSRPDFFSAIEELERDIVLLMMGGVSRNISDG